MALSETFGFLRIFKESIHLLPKNGKSMASITLLSILLPSTISLFFIYFYQSLTNHMTNSIINSAQTDDSSLHRLIIVYTLLLILVEFAAIIAYVITSHISLIATILVSATSYTDHKISPRDLFSRTYTTWRNQLSRSFRKPKNPTRFASVGVILATLLAILYHNFITICIAVVLGVLFCVYQLYASVVWVLSYVVSTVEGVYEGTEALGRAERIVEGNKHHGFAINVFFNVVLLIVFWGCWMVLGDEGPMNLTVYGLVFVNCMSVGKMFGCIAYTVYYFQCRKYHGEDLDVVGKFDYVKVPNADLGGDVA